MTSLSPYFVDQTVINDQHLPPKVFVHVRRARAPCLFGARFASLASAEYHGKPLVGRKTDTMLGEISPRGPHHSAARRKEID